MSHLSKALENYYSRQGNRILFRNGRSLNALALVMWEYLGFQQIDASVLSRVLKGSRLFTSQQLKAFCVLLNIPKKEEEYLFACLQYDHDSRLEMHTGITFIPQDLAREVISELTRDAFDIFYRGDYERLESKGDLVRRVAEMYMMNNDDKEVVGEALGFHLYLRGRSVVNGELPSLVVKKVYPIFNQLINLSRTSHSRILYGYAHVLLCTAYYVAGGYSDSSKKQKVYSMSIEHAKKAASVLSEDNHEYLFALRSMAASAYYTHDQDTISYIFKKAKELIPLQPEENYINTLHLAITLGKDTVTSGASNPFLVKELATDHFKKDLSNTGVYEVSGIKEEVDTLLLLNTQDKAYIRDRIKEGMKLSDKYNFSRQKKYFTNLLRNF